MNCVLGAMEDLFSINAQFLYGNLTQQVGWCCALKQGEATCSSCVHLSVLSEEEERYPPTGALRHYQWTEGQLTHTDKDLHHLYTFFC